MRTSVSVFFSDILPQKRSMYQKVVKNHFFEKNTPSEGLSILKEQGLDGIEICLPQFGAAKDEDILEVKKLLEDIHLPVLSVHQSLRFFTATKITEITRLFAIAHIFGAKVIVLHMNTAKKQIFDPSYIAAIHALEQQYGIRAAFENMEKHIGSLMYKHRWQDVAYADLINKTNFHMTLDIVHLAHSGGDIIEFFKKNQARIINIHLSDYKHNPLNSTLRPLRYKHMPLGRGELPIHAFLETLQEADYKGLVTMEIHTDLHGITDGTRIINKYKK